MARYNKSIVRKVRAKRSCRPASFAKIFFASAAATVSVGAWFIWWNQRQVRKGRVAFPAFVQAMPAPRGTVTLPEGRPQITPRLPAPVVEV